MTKLEAYLKTLSRSQRNIVVGVSWSGDLIDPCFDISYVEALHSISGDPNRIFHIGEKLEESGASHFFLSHGFTRKFSDLDRDGKPFEVVDVLPHNDITFLGVQDLNRIELEALPPFLTPVERFI
tara:strand:+ start:155 stop:529 length:375 start_codon:yes stop_codon:yes gene_type:complete